MSNSKLPERPSLEFLKKTAKVRLQELRQTNPSAKLAEAQLEVARRHGFASWRALKAQLDVSRPKRKLASPAMRFLPVADLGRSIAFYRNVLGFDVKRVENAVEAVLGPVRIRLGREGYSAGDWMQENVRPPGSAIVFLQSEDIENVRQELLNKGGAPSDLENVNWLKLRVFEIRDPDGNVLWFGQSYNKPDSRTTRGLRQALPELPFDNVSAAVAYYRDILGFRINYQQEDLGVMDRDAITILLIPRTPEHRGIGSFEVYVTDADKLYEELLAKGVDIDGPPVSHPGVCATSGFGILREIESPSHSRLSDTLVLQSFTERLAIRITARRAWVRGRPGAKSGWWLGLRGRFQK